MKPILLLLSIAIGLSANAQTFKVTKVKGNKAVIELPKGITLEKGQRYAIDSEATEDLSGSHDTGERSRIVGGSVDLFVGSTKTGSTSESIIQFSGDAKFGWNTGELEYGPLLTLAYQGDSDSKTRTIGLGGFLDYNFTPNTFGTNSIYGLGARLSIGQSTNERNVSNRTTSDSSTTLAFGAGPFAKWFVFGHTTCLRGDLRLDYSSVSDDGVDTTTIGLTGALGIETYF